MISLEQIIYVIPILGLTASILYYAMVFRAANKTQQMQLETRQTQLFMQIYGTFNDKDFQRDYFKMIYRMEWDNLADFREKFDADER